MYSLTETGVHHIYQPQQNEPQAKIKCKSNRVVLQQQVYTCLSCSTYCDHFSTVPQISSYQCRACKRLYQGNTKNNRCTFCFSCPYCHNVLTLSKDPKSKNFIYHCQFCYWNSKQINMKEERAQILQDNLFKLTNLRQTQNRIYTAASTFFKQSNISTQLENQFFKYTHNRKPSIRSTLEETGSRDKQHMKKINEGLQNMIKHTSLEQDSEEYANNQHKYPQALPLIAKKIRRCPECSKPLTNIYRPAVSNEPNIELMHKELKIIQCQRLPAVDGKVQVKFLKNCVVGDKSYKINEIQQWSINTDYKVLALIENKRKNAEVLYDIVIEPYQKRK